LIASDHSHIIPIMSSIVSRAIAAARSIGTLSTLTLWFRMRVINSMSMLILIPFVRTVTSTSAPRHHRQISVGQSVSTFAQSVQTSKYGTFHGVAHGWSAQLGMARRAMSTDPPRDGKVRGFSCLALFLSVLLLRRILFLNLDCVRFICVTSRFKARLQALRLLRERTLMSPQLVTLKMSRCVCPVHFLSSLCIHCD
jgi:hypothetical protein